MHRTLTSLVCGTTLLLALSACGTSPSGSVNPPAAPDASLGSQAINCPTHDCTGPVNPPPSAPPVTPPPPAASLPGSGPNIRLKVVIDSVTARDNIEWTGVDEFYLLGDLLVSKPDGSRRSVPFVVPTFDIDEGQTHFLNQVVLDEVVTPGSDVIGKMTAFDEDFSKDWLSVRAKVIAAANAAAGGAALLGPKGVVVAGILQGMISVADPILSNIDHDDKLGDINVASTYLNYNMVPKIFSKARLYANGWYDSFDYDVRYHIEAERTTSALTF